VFFFANAKFGIFVATARSWSRAVALAFLCNDAASPIMPVVTAIIVVVFGGLTLVLHDATFIKVKPTIIYALFGAVLLGGLLFNKPLLRHGVRFDVSPDRRGLAQTDLRWALFFLRARVLNEIVWRNFSTRILGRFKVFGVVPLTFLFGALQCRC
jgi:intracellular septation protein